MTGPLADPDCFGVTISTGRDKIAANLIAAAIPIRIIKSQLVGKVISNTPYEANINKILEPHKNGFLPKPWQAETINGIAQIFAKH